MSGTVARSLGALGDALGGTANVNFDAGTLFIDGANNNVGIGTTSPGTRLQIGNPSDSNQGLRFDFPDSSTARINSTRIGAGNLQSLQLAGQDALQFLTNGAERARVNSDGQFLVGKTTGDINTNGVLLTSGACHQVFNITNNENWIFNNRTTGTSYNLSFRTNNSVRGNITVTDSGTTYNTSSDYRLKENITAIANAGERLLNLKPCRFNFISDPTRTVDGFLAHEAAEVVPQAVTGEKDAVNEDGSIKAQGIDHSKLVPLLTAALQEALLSINDLKAEVQTLKTKIAALESN